METRARFTRMQDGTAEEYALIDAAETAYARTLPTRVLDAVRALGTNGPQKYAVSRWFDATAEFCERYDENCFDPGYDWLPLEHFVPAVEEVFTRKPSFS